MKYIPKLLCASLLLLGFLSCKKVGDLPYYNNGKTPTLTTSVSAIAAPAADSLANVLTLSWTFPDYATDSSNTKFVIQIDSAGGDFSHAASRTVSGALSATYTAKDLNTILLGYGYAFGIPQNLNVRVISSYANNNEQLISNTVTLQVTPYKIPPKVALPASGRLFIVGDATDFGWTNDPAPPFPADREFTNTSETVWEGLFNMKGSGGYKLLQTQGDWNTQFHMVAGGSALTGSFIQENADPAFSSPAAGPYKLIFDFQTGKYTLEPWANPIVMNLYITGDAVPSSWTNTPPANQKFTQITNSIFELTIDLAPGFYYKFLSNSGNWQPQFGGSSATSGDLGANFGSGNDPAAVPTPAEAGTYKIQVNFLTNSYTVTKM